MKNQGNFILLLGIIFLSYLNCRSGSNTVVVKEAIPKNASIAVLVEGENDFKNAVFMEFMKGGYDVKAFNATDFYSTEDVLGVHSFKKTAFISTLFDPKNSQKQVDTADKVFENIYKLHIFNFENLKMEMLQNLKKKMGIKYVVVLSLVRWDTGNSWVRVVKLENMQLVYVQNLKVQRKDDLKSVIGTIVGSMQAGK